jgi:hypothetical protein
MQETREEYIAPTATLLGEMAELIKGGAGS